MDTGNEDIHENFNLKNISIREYNVGRNWRKKFKRIKFSKFGKSCVRCTSFSPLRNARRILLYGERGKMEKAMAKDFADRSR